jgi:hypothetical protein
MRRGPEIGDRGRQASSTRVIAVQRYQTKRVGSENIPLRCYPKSRLKLRPYRSDKRGAGFRHERWGGLRSIGRARLRDFP